MQEISRRTFATGSLVALLASHAQAAGLRPAAGQFGQINKLTAKAGKVAALHAELTALTRSLTASLPDALTYEVLTNETDPNVLWTVELWSSAELHATSVATPPVQASIARCKLLIERFENLATFNTGAPIAGRRGSKS